MRVVVEFGKFEGLKAERASPSSSDDVALCRGRRRRRLAHHDLRSPASDPAKALIGMKGALERAGVRARVILANIAPEDELRELFADLSALSPREPAHELIRWARNPRLLDAHEQVTYGDIMCWSGDAMRRDADKRNALTLFDESAGDAVRHGRLAFEALWSSCALVPRGG